MRLGRLDSTEPAPAGRLPAKDAPLEEVQVGRPLRVLALLLPALLLLLLLPLSVPLLLPHLALLLVLEIGRLATAPHLER